MQSCSIPWLASDELGHAIVALIVTVNTVLVLRLHRKARPVPPSC